MRAPAPLRVGAYQGNGHLKSFDQALDHIVSIACEAVAMEADILCFPECYLTGYVTNLSDAAPRAIEAHSEDFARVVARLADLPVTVVIGFLERSDRQISSSALITRSGQVAGVYRKQRPNEQGFSAGNPGGVFDAGGVRIGVNICNDANHPELARQLARDGADVILYPLNNMLRRDTADLWRARHLESLIARARETACWVVASDVVGETATSIGYGCTVIVSPGGEVVAQAPEGHEALVASPISPAGW